MFRQGENIAAAMGQAISLGWIGKWVSVYADDDPFWKDLAKVKEDEVESFLEKNVGPAAGRGANRRFRPAASWPPSSARLRAFVLSRPPRALTQWESLKYKEQPYVRISPVKGNQALPR